MNKAIDRPLPVDVKSEESVLGAVFVDQKAFDIAEDLGLTADDFYGSLHQQVWKAMSAIKGRDGQIDLLTVRDEINSHGGLPDSGGESSLVKIASCETMSSRVEAHTQIVIEYSCRRAIIVASQKAAAEAQEGQRPSEEIISDAGIQFLELTRTRGQGVERHVEAHVGEAIRQLEDRAAGKAKGISTGLLDMDLKIGGFYPTDMIVLASRPGVGKTALALNWA